MLKNAEPNHDKAGWGIKALGGMVYNLVYNMIPVAKGRPRFTRHGFAFTPKKTRDAEERLRWLMRQQWKQQPLATPIRIGGTFFMPIPQSFSKKKRQNLWGKPHTYKPDIDNLLKTLLDSGNDILYTSDAIIYSVSFKKVYSDLPRIEMVIYENEDMVGT